MYPAFCCADFQIPCRYFRVCRWSYIAVNFWRQRQNSEGRRKNCVFGCRLSL